MAVFDDISQWLAPVTKDLKSAGKQAVRGVVDIPENWANVHSLLSSASKVPYLANALTPVAPWLQAYKLTDPSQGTELAKAFRQGADELAPTPPPEGILEKAIRGATSVVADPLTWVAPGAILPNLAVGGTLGAGIGQLQSHTPPSAGDSTFTDPIKSDIFADLKSQGTKSLEEAFPVEGNDTLKYALGAGAALAAAAAARRFIPGLRPTVPVSGRSVQGVGEAADVAAQPVSATLPREGRKHILADDKDILLSQAKRSLPGPPDKNLAGLDQTTDIFTKGVPEQGSMGAKRISEVANTYGPPTAPVVTQPVPPTMTKKQFLDSELPRLVHETSPDSVASRASHFMETGEIMTPSGLQAASWNGRRIIPKQLIETEAVTPGLADDAQYYRGLRQTLDDHFHNSDEALVAPTLTRLLGERNMLPTPKGDLIPDYKNPGKVDPTLIKAALSEVWRLEKNPAFLQHVKAVERIPRFLAEIGVDYGMSPTEIKKMISAHPHYMPTRETKDPLPVTSWERWWDKMKAVWQLDKNIADSFDQYRAFHYRASEHGTGVQHPRNFMEELNHYIPVVMHTYSRNDAQRKLFYILRNSEDNKIARSFRVYGKGDEGNKSLRDKKGATWFWDGDVKIGVSFTDELMHQAFRLMPAAIHLGPLNALRRTMQQGTTGLLSIFPITKAFIYDSVIANATRPAGSIGGGVPLLNRAGSEPIKMMYDTIKGASQVLVAKNRIRMAEEINRHIAKNSEWYQQFDAMKGPGAARQWADDLTQAYADSVYGQLRAGGALGSTQYIERVLSSSQSRLESAVPAWRNRVGPGLAYQAWHGFKAIYESVLNSHRVMYALRNKARPDVTQEAAKLLGDFTKRGSGIISTGRGGAIKYQEPDSVIDKIDTVLARLLTGKTGQFISTGLNETVPYFNVAVQGTRLLINRLTGPNWASTAGGIMATIGVPATLGALAVAVLGPEYQQYWKSLPGYMRSGMLYMPLPGQPPERGLHIPVPPELAVFNSVVNYGVASLLGLNQGTLSAPTSPYVQDDIADALGNWLNVFSPIPISLMANLGGLELRNRGQSLAGDFANIVPFPDIQKSMRESLTGAAYAKRPNAILPGWIEDTMTTLFGTAFQMVLGTAEATLKADSGAIGAGLTQLGNDVLRRTPVFKSIHGFHAEAASNNAKRRFAEKSALVDRITNVVDVMRMAGGVSQRMPTNLPIDAANMLPQWNDPVWRQKAFAVKQAFDGDPALRRLTLTRGELRKELEALSAKRPLTRDTQRDINVLRQREIAMSEAMYQMLRQKEQALGFRLEDIDPTRTSWRP